MKKTGCAATPSFWIRPRSWLCVVHNYVVKSNYSTVVESNRTRSGRLYNNFIIITPGWVGAKIFISRKVSKGEEMFGGKKHFLDLWKTDPILPPVILLLPVRLRMGRKGKASHAFPSPHQEERLSVEKRTDSGGGGEEVRQRHTHTHTHTEQREPVVDFLTRKLTGLVGALAGARYRRDGYERKSRLPKAKGPDFLTVQPNPIRSQVPSPKDVRHEVARNEAAQH